MSSSIDSQRNTGMLLQLSYALENNADELCSVYRMSPYRRRKRGINEDGEIINLFQGEFPVERERRGEIYPGDRKVRSPERVTVQIHTLDLTKDEGREKQVIMENVPITTVWVPRRLARAWVTQEQPTQDD